MTMVTYLLGLCGWAVMSATIMMGLSYPANMFIALTSPPTQRAAWTAGVVYALATLILIFGGQAEYLLVSALIPLPGLLILFWFWRREYRKAWIDNVDQLPDSTALENDDWKAGLIKLIGLIAAAIIATLIRRSLNQ
jgi:protein-S-isoprenylcysteine O-methyltransferase Ste14